MQMRTKIQPINSNWLLENLWYFIWNMLQKYVCFMSRKVPDIRYMN